MDALWQTPYVNVFKGLAGNIDLEGDVQQITDKKISKTIFKISGQTPSANYVRVPKSGKPPLGLVGQFVYVIFRTEVGRPYVLHFDVATNDYPLRLSFSNIYKNIKKSTRGVMIPLGEFPRWSVLAFHLPPIIQRYSGLRFATIRSIQLCSRMEVLNVLTSENNYNTKSLPREVALVRPKGQEWESLYDWVVFPPEPRSHAPNAQDAPESDYATIPKNMPVHPTPAESVPKHAPGFIMTRQSSLSKKMSKAKSISSGPSHKLTLARVVGYTGSVKWVENDATKYVLYAANDVAILHDAATGAQQFLRGANGRIASLAAWFPLPHSAPHRAPPPVFVAVAQEKPNLIRLFTLSNDIFSPAPSPLGPAGSAARLISVPGPVQSLSFAFVDGRGNGRGNERNEKEKGSERNEKGEGRGGAVLMMAAGHDTHGRTVVGVWQVWPEYYRICMHTSDIHITQLRVYSGGGVTVDASHPVDCVRMVSCGRGNVRAWRLKEESNADANEDSDPLRQKRYTLKGCAIDLGRYLETTFTDIGFEVSPHTSHFHSPLRAYVSSTSGLVFQINLDDLFVEAIYNLHAHTPVNAVAANEGFCITGGGEGLVRIWPLDFADFLIEAKHDGPIRSLDISSDGLHLVVGSESTSIGTLDIPSRSYHTFLRSHSKTILAITGINSGDDSEDKSEIATASEDKTVRIWSARFPKMDQVFEFSFASDVPLCLASHPNARVLAVGFSSGFMRVLDIQMTTTIHEIRQHQGPILSIAYSPDGSRLFTLSHDSALVIYDCTGKYLPVHVIPTQNRFPSSCQLSTTFEKNGEYIAYVGGDAQTVILLNSTTLRPMNIFHTPTLRAIHIAPMYPHKDVSILCTTTDGNLLIFTEEGLLLQQVPIRKQEPNTQLDKVPETNPKRKVKQVGTECGWVTASSNGRYIATGGEGALFIWDRAAPDLAGREKDVDFWPWQVFVAHMDPIYGATFSAQDDHLLCVGEGGVIAVWSVDGSIQNVSGKHKPIKAPPKKTTGSSPIKHSAHVPEVLASQYVDNALHEGSYVMVHSLGYSPGRENIIWKPESGLLAYPNGSLIVLEDLRSGTKCFLQQHQITKNLPFPSSPLSPPFSTGKSQNSHPLSPQSVTVKSHKRKKRTRVLHPSEIHTLDLSPDGKLLLSVSSVATIWQLHNIPAHFVLQPSDDSLSRTACFTRDGNFAILAAGNGKSLYVWYLQEAQPRCVASITLPHVAHTIISVQTSKNTNKEKPSTHIQEFVTLGDGPPFYWFLHHNFTLQCQPLHPNLEEAVWSTGVFLPPNHLILGTTDGRVRIWDTSSHSLVSTSRLLDDEICTMTLDSQGESLVVSGNSLRKFYIQRKNGKLNFTPPFIGQLLPNQDESTRVAAVVMDASNTVGVIGTADGSISNIRWWDKASLETPIPGSMTQSILHHSAGTAIEDARYSQNGNFMIICDAEYVHLWRFAGDGADTAFPAHETRVKSQGARCIALSAAHHHDAAHAAWGCADGRVNFYDATTQAHALYIPAQPLRVAPGSKGVSSPISAMCFVFSRLVLCGDESGMLFLVEFGPDGPHVVQSIEVHNKRITSMDSGKQGTIVVSDESGSVSVWTTLPSPPFLQNVDFVEFSHLFPSAAPHPPLSTLARVLPTATSSPTTNAALSHPTSVFVAVKLQTQVITCTYDYHAKKVTCVFPNLALGEDLRAAHLLDAAILQLRESGPTGPRLHLQPILAIGGELLTPSRSHFTLNGFAGPPKGVRFAADGDLVVAFSENQVILWKTPQ